MSAWLGAMRRGLQQCGRGLLDLLLPDCCAACGRGDVSAAGLCTECNIKLLSLVSLPYCPRCAATRGPNVPLSEDGCFLCPDPLPRFEAAYRLGPYHQPLRSVIQGLKYHRHEAMRRRLGRMLAQALAAGATEAAFDAIVPVPMHWRRRISRGYDHSRRLACALGDEIGVPVADELARVRHTPPQVHLPRSRRIANVRGAFQAADGGDVQGASVLLVDDVITTGATANEATRTLLAAGAARVTLAVLAKAEPPRAYAGGAPAPA